MEKISIGIRREDKNQWERRVPLTPTHVEQLIAQGFSVTLQPSLIRVFSDDTYRGAGAIVSEDLSGCKVVFGVKEMPKSIFVKDHLYVFFTHVIKGQPYNMAMLKEAMKRGATIIDYEKITDDNRQRLIFFGRHAGQAGMLDTLWALGRRLKAQRYSSLFESLRQAFTYASLSQARQEIAVMAQRFASDGWSTDALPCATPLVVGFAGYGNVSRGSQEICDLFPHCEVTPGELATVVSQWKPDDHRLIKVVFREENTVRPKQSGVLFEYNDYIANPQNYEGIFHQYLPYLTILINAIFWLPSHPRLITLDNIRNLYRGKLPRLQVIGDISCDINGGIECTVQSTTPADPVFVYDVDRNAACMGVEGNGPVILAVDNLPCEIPLESSVSFADALLPFVPCLAQCDCTVAFEQLALPKAIKQAIIVYRGSLTEPFAYLQPYIDRHTYAEKSPGESQ